MNSDVEQMWAKRMLPADIEADRDALIAYLNVCVRNQDWHAVSDAANDLRVLEARMGKR